MTFQDALDDIYHWYMDAKPTVKGRFDRDVRDPQIIISIAQALEILPPAERIIRITGSKGKGTVSRTLANALGRCAPERVGLLVSPEEFEHTDRMQIDGAPITQDEFLSHYRQLRPHLCSAAEALQADRYLSPSGIFLLIALSWFRQRGVGVFVLETGRGARFDEAGQIPSGVSVVTSIFLEHVAYLGPDLEDIAADKLHIAGSSGTLVLGPSAAEWLHLLPSESNIALVAPQVEDRGPEHHPAWMWEDRLLAQTALSVFLQRDAEVLDADLASAAFVNAQVGSAQLYVEPLISAASIDDRFLDGLAEQYGDRLAVVASLPDDKGIDGVVDAVARRDLPMFHIVLHGTRGYLTYETVKSRFSGQVLADVQFDDIGRLQAELRDLVDTGNWRALYVIGTHTFIRGVKLALRYSPDTG